MLFSDLLQSIMASPFGGFPGGPVLPALPKASSNVSAPGLLPSLNTASTPADFTNAMTSASEAPIVNRLREAQMRQAEAKASLFGAALQPPPPMFGGQGSDTRSIAPTAAPGIAAQGGNGDRAVSNYTADATLPPEARAFLDTIAGPESGGAYNVRYTPGGGTTFSDYSAHPNIPEKGPAGPSTAAGRYEIVYSTWEPLAKKLGLSNFEPVSQDQAAWRLAQEAYHVNTGRDLLADLQSGRTQDIAPALSGEWPTIGRSIGNYEQNLSRYTSGGVALGGNGQTLPAVPDFAGMMRGEQGQPYAPASPPVASAFASVGPQGPLGQAIGQAAQTLRPPAAPLPATISPSFGTTARAAPPSSMPVMSPQQFAEAARARLAPAAAINERLRAQLGLSSPGSGVPPISPAYLAWAQQQDRINSLLGIRNPVAVQNALEMAPGGPLSLDYLRAKAAAVANAQVGPHVAEKLSVPMATRYGLVDPLTGKIIGGYTTLQKIANPDGSESYAYVTPPTEGNPNPTVVPVGANAAIGLGQEETLKAHAATLGKEYGDVVAAFQNAQRSLPNLEAIRSAMENFRTGPSAAARLGLSRAWQDFAQSVGLPPDSDLAKAIASGEIINKSGTWLGFNLARSLGSREAQMIVQQSIAANPNLLASPQGNEQLIGLISQGFRRDMDKREFFDNWYAANHSYDGAATAFDRAAPVQSYISRILPAHPGSKAAYDQLPPGTTYAAPDGSMRVKPADPRYAGFLGR